MALSEPFGRARSALVASLALACAACGRAREEPKTPATSTEYVKKEEWQSPPSAQRIEEEIDRGPKTPAGPVDLPALTRHQGIPKDRAYRLARPRGVR